MDDRFSPLQRLRLAYNPPVPKVLAASVSTHIVPGAVLKPERDADVLARLFPKTFGRPTLRIEASGASAGERLPLSAGIVLSGGQASGGHNVVSGLFDGLKNWHPESKLYGFLNGPRGLFTGKYIELTAERVAGYRNMGGFDIIGSGRDKIEKPDEFAASKAVAEELGLDAVVVVGGDDSNTNAAVLAEYFEAQGSRTRVIGCPKTIDGDLKCPGVIDVSFGFDTACAVYSEQVGNIALDGLSSNKYYAFVRLMGRAASNIALEVALQTHPTICLLGEEVAARHQNLASIAEEIASVVAERAAEGKNQGVILVPEGLIEFVPEMGTLIAEINELLAAGRVEATAAAVIDNLSANSAALMRYLPDNIQRQLLAERDPHGNVQVSLIETEKLLADLVQHELERMRRAGRYGGTFSAQCFFLGYEGRAALPSDFDTVYCYALGLNAATLLAHGATGVMSSVTGLDKPVEQWACCGVPLTALMNIERRKGKDKPVIRKWLVDLKGAPFRAFAEARHAWALSDSYRAPGPLQLDTTGRRHRKANGSHVLPLCVSLSLELAERERHAHGGAGAAAGGIISPSGSAGGSSAAAASGDGAAAASTAAAADAHHDDAHARDVAKYDALLEGLLEMGTDAVSTRDVYRLSLFRAAHGVKDEEHTAALRRLGLNGDVWRGVETRARRTAAGIGGSGGASPMPPAAAGAGAGVEAPGGGR